MACRLAHRGSMTEIREFTHDVHLGCVADRSAAGILDHAGGALVADATWNSRLPGGSAPGP